jgi:hypothetical protein
VFDSAFFILGFGLVGGFGWDSLLVASSPDFISG